MSDRSVHTVHTESPADEPAAVNESSCPPPLAWQDVCAAVRNDGHALTATAGRVELKATAIGSGPAVLFLPGFLGDHELFSLVAWLLREDRRCLLIDAPNLPREIRDDPESILDDWSKALLSLAEQDGHSRFDIHATSVGALAALQCLVKSPKHVRSASIQCGFARWTPTRTERLLMTLGERSGGEFGRHSSAMHVQEQSHRPWFPPFDLTRWDFYRSNVGATPVQRAVRLGRLAAAVDLRPVLSNIHVPVLIVKSEGDGAVALGSQEELEAGLAQTRTESLDNAGRSAHVTHPHRLVKLLRDFWESTS